MIMSDHEGAYGTDPFLVEELKCGDVLCYGIKRGNSTYLGGNRVC